MRVEIGITTIGSFNHLSVLLWSLLTQNYQDWDVTIIDDSPDPKKDFREVPCLSDLLKLLVERGHTWRVFYGERKGWHYAQQIILDQATHPVIWMLDEDQAFDPSVMRKLVGTLFFRGDMGAVGGVAYLAGDYNRTWVPDDWENDEKWNGVIYINEKGVGFGNRLQQCPHPTNELKFVQHLIGGCMMYQTELGRKWGFNKEFSYIARCSDNLFSYMFHNAGYKLCVVPDAVIWHFPSKFYGTVNKESPEFLEMSRKDRILFEKTVVSLTL